MLTLKVGDEIRLIGRDDETQSHPARIAQVKNMFGEQWVKLVNGYHWIKTADLEKRIAH